MAETYSLGVTAAPADQQSGVETLTLPDSACQGATANNLGGLQYEAMTNGQMFCKRADGSFGWYTLDAERSTPTTPVLKAV